MKMETRCWVVGSDGKVIVFAGDFVSLLSSVVNGPQTHVLVKYWDDIDSKDRTYGVFPKESVYFSQIGVE